MTRRRLTALAFVAALALSVPATASADKPLHKCNAGAGNGSEGAPFHDCDPGNSGANNQAGD